MLTDGLVPAGTEDSGWYQARPDGALLRMGGREGPGATGPRDRPVWQGARIRSQWFVPGERGAALPGGRARWAEGDSQRRGW